MSQESYSGASWIVELADEFVAEFMTLDRPVRIELTATAELLAQGASLSHSILGDEQSCSVRGASQGKVRAASIER